MNATFDDFRATLSTKQKEFLDKILDDETRQKRKALEDSLVNDRNHLEIVNFCANLFLPGQMIPEKTGYSFVLVEPLYPLRVKNFDLGFFRKENSSLILTECKSSVSDSTGLIDDLNKSIVETSSRKAELERVLGNKIADPVEFAVCLPAVDAQDVHNEIVAKKAPICVWAASLWERKMKLFGGREETKTEIELGRLHRDSNLNSILGTGVESNLLRSIPILPSSHMCTLLVYVAELIYLKTKERMVSSAEFQYSDVLNILSKELKNMTGLSERDFEDLTTNVFRTAIKKDVFRDLTEDIEELTRKMFQISGRRTSAEVVRNNVEQSYLDHNAREKAKIQSLTQYKKEKGFTEITSWTPKDNGKT